MATTQEKADAFDVLMGILKGKHEYVGCRRVLTENLPASVNTPIPTTCTFKDVAQYRWTIAIDGDTDIESVLIQQAKKLSNMKAMAQDMEDAFINTSRYKTVDK